MSPQRYAATRARRLRMVRALAALGRMTPPAAPVPSTGDPVVRRWLEWGGLPGCAPVGLADADGSRRS